MDIRHIISNALVEYDSARSVIKFLMSDEVALEGIMKHLETERNIFKFYDRESDELILETEVEVLAVFYDKFNIWTWAWAHIGLTNSENYLAKEILMYAVKLGIDASYLKSILVTSKGIINDTTQIDINLALGTSIVKCPYIYPFVVYTSGEYNLIYYMILLNNEGLDKIKTTHLAIHS